MEEFDLFEDDDDYIITAACNIPSTEGEAQNSRLPEFNCNGEDSLNSQFGYESFVKNYFLFTKVKGINKNVELTPYNFKGESLVSKPILNYTFAQARMYIQSLVVGLKGRAVPIDISIYHRRREVTMMLHSLYASNEIAWSSIEKDLCCLRKLINSASSKEMLKSISMANFIKGNETDSPAYHLLHGLLEWKFLDLLILEENQNNYETDFDYYEETNEMRSPSFGEQYQMVLQDFVIISISLFTRKNVTILMSNSPFPCTCIKECWLLSQLLVEKANNAEAFWSNFNKIIEKIQLDPESFMLTSKKVSEFTLWLLKGLIFLQGYNKNGVFEGPSHPRVTENYQILVSTVENFFGSNPTEEEIRSFLCMLMPIILEWWSPKMDIPMILWEYFHKKLNSPFFIPGSTPNNLAVASSSGKGYLVKIENILESNNPDPKLSSFELFSIILGKIVYRFGKLRQTHQTQKILGRIYSKFTISKFLTFSETGLHNLIELFLSVALSADAKDVAVKLKDKLLSIPLDKLPPNRQVCLSKGHVAFLILFSEQGLDISEYVVKMLEQFTSIKNDLAVSRVLAEGLYEIVRLTDTFERGEHTLIDAWLPNLLSASPVDVDRILECVHIIFDKIKKTSLWNLVSGDQNSQKLVKNLTSHILPFIKQQFSTNFSPWLPVVAADFCEATLDDEQFKKMFKHFININCSNKEAAPKFLMSILLSSKNHLVESSTIINIWLKSLVLLSIDNEDVVSLMKVVCALPDFKEVTSITTGQLLTASEPLSAFITSVAMNHEKCQDYQKKCVINEKLNSYLANFENWVSNANEPFEVKMRFYRFLTVVIHNCGKMVYTRSKISCFFHIAMTRFIIPGTIQVGKTPDPQFCQIMRMMWPVLVMGVGNLNFKTDPYIRKTLTDLIVKWTPHFKVSSVAHQVARPFVDCFLGDNEPLALFVVQKLTEVFLTMQRRQADPNACLVITIFQEIVDSFKNDESKMLIFIKASGFTILEHLMMVDEIVPSRKLLLNLLEKIIQSEAFSKSEETKNAIIEHLKQITVKHLSYFTFFYFELLTQLLKLSPPIVKEIIEFLKQEVRVVEEKRGGGPDNRLRSCLEKLQGALLAASNK